MTLRDELENERINLGGWLLTRAEAARFLAEQGVDPRAIDRCVWAARAVPEAEWDAFAPDMRGYTNATAAELLEGLGLG